jgi:hypothetical protein
MTAMRRSRFALLARFGCDFFVGAVLLYGYVYTAYKYGNPFFGRNDFCRYKEMIAHPFDFSVVPAPFVLRQIPTIVASVFYGLGAHLDTAATVDTIGFDDDAKRRFLAMILSNGFAVCASFAVLSSYLRAKLVSDSIINSLVLFGILAGWFYFPSVVIAPVTTGWGWFASSLFAIAFLERNAAITIFASAVALFSRETTLIFALTMFLALLLVEGDRGRGVVASILVLAASCLLYLALRTGLTGGYEHQIDPAGIANRIAALSFPFQYFVQLILAQGLPFLLLLTIAMRRPRYAAYLVASALVIALVALAAGVTDVGLLIGETLPFYAAIFILAWNGALPMRAADKREIDATGKSLRSRR